MNRDYNLDLAYYKIGDYTANEVFLMFKEQLKGISKVEVGTNRSIFFVPGFAIKMDIFEDEIKMKWCPKSGDQYKLDGKTIKHPKITTALTSDEFIKLVLDSLSPSMKEVLNIQ